MNAQSKHKAKNAYPKIQSLTIKVIERLEPKIENPKEEKYFLSNILDEDDSSNHEILNTQSQHKTKDAYPKVQSSTIKAIVRLELN